MAHGPSTSTNHMALLTARDLGNGSQHVNIRGVGTSAATHPHRRTLIALKRCMNSSQGRGSSLLNLLSRLDRDMPDPAAKDRIIIVNIYLVFSIHQHVLNLTFSCIVLFYPLNGPMRKLLL